MYIRCSHACRNKQTYPYLQKGCRPQHRLLALQPRAQELLLPICRVYKAIAVLLAPFPLPVVEEAVLSEVVRAKAANLIVYEGALVN